MSAIQLITGLKFTSIHFRAEAEIMRIRTAENEVDVVLTPSDGHAWEEKSWSLQHMKAGFERGEYIPEDKTQKLGVI